MTTRSKEQSQTQSQSVDTAHVSWNEDTSSRSEHRIDLENTNGGEALITNSAKNDVTANETDVETSGVASTTTSAAVNQRVGVSSSDGAEQMTNNSGSGGGGGGSDPYRGQTVVYQQTPSGYYVTTSEPRRGSYVDDPHTRRQVVIVGDGNCPVCGIGYVTNTFSFVGVLFAVLCFPCGIICCLLFMVPQCNYCGAIF